MWYWLKLIFIGHIHNWKIIQQTELQFNRGDDWGRFWKCRGDRYILQCTVCGDIKKKDCK